jgi:Organic solute transporter Ostalpha
MLCEAFNVLCQSEGFNFHYANVYLSAIDFISIRFVNIYCGTARMQFTPFCSIALYGLILFYSLTKEELKGRRPLAKFLAMKLIVMFTFYQSFLVCNWRFNRQSKLKPSQDVCSGRKGHSRYVVIL